MGLRQPASDAQLDLRLRLDALFRRLQREGLGVPPPERLDAIAVAGMTGAAPHDVLKRRVRATILKDTEPQAERRFSAAFDDIFAAPDPLDIAGAARARDAVRDALVTVDAPAVAPDSERRTIRRNLGWLLGPLLLAAVLAWWLVDPTIFLPTPNPEETPVVPEPAPSDATGAVPPPETFAEDPGAAPGAPVDPQMLGLASVALSVLAAGDAARMVTIPRLAEVFADDMPPGLPPARFRHLLSQRAMIDPELAFPLNESTLPLLVQAIAGLLGIADVAADRVAFIARPLPPTEDLTGLGDPATVRPLLTFVALLDSAGPDGAAVASSFRRLIGAAGDIGDLADEAAPRDLRARIEALALPFDPGAMIRLAIDAGFVAGPVWQVPDPLAGDPLDAGALAPGRDAASFPRVVQEAADRFAAHPVVPGGTRIVSGSGDDTLRLWDAATGAEVAVLRGHGGDVYSVAFSPDGTRIVSGSLDDTLRLWDAATGAEVAVLRGHGGVVSGVAFSPDGTRIVSGSLDGTLRLWDAATGAEVAVLRGHEDGVLSVAFSPDGTRIVSGSDDGTLRLWDAATGAEVAVLRGHGSWVTGVAFSLDGTRIVSGSLDDTLRLWDAATGTEVAVLRGHESEVNSVAFSPDGTRIVSGSWDRTLRLWDAATGAEVAVLRGHEGLVTSVAFSPDGTRIVSGSDDTLRLWDAATGAEVAVLRGHEGWVNSVAFSPAHPAILSAAAAEETGVAPYAPLVALPPLGITATWTAYLAALAIPLGLLALRWITLRRRLEAWFTRHPPPLSFAPHYWGGLPQEADRALGRDRRIRAARDLARPERRETRRLDPVRTVLASARALGRFTPVRARVPRIPRYLAIVISEGRSDIQARQFRELIAGLGPLGRSVEIWFLDHDGNALSRDPHEAGADPSRDKITLRDLWRRLPDRRVIVLGSGTVFLDPVAGRPLAWTDTFRRWPSAALMTPRARPDWDMRETVLGEIFPDRLFEATPEGLQDLARAPAAAPDPDPAPFVPAHAPLWETSPSLLMQDTAPDPALLARLERELSDMLGRTGMLWLRAAAVYPVFTWELTVYLGTALTEADAEAGRPDARQIYDPDLFRDLSRLPWFRKARFPVWASLWLQQGLTRPQRRKVLDLLLGRLAAAEETSARSAVFITAGAREAGAIEADLDPERRRVFLRLLAGHSSDRLAIAGTRALAQQFQAASGGFWRGEALILTTLAIYAAVAALVAPWPWDGTALTGGEYLPLTVLLLTGAVTYPLLLSAVGAVPRETRT